MKILEKFPKSEIVELIKTIDIKGIESDSVTDFYCNESINTFNIKGYCVKFNNNIMIELIKVNDFYSVKIGKNKGLVGGLCIPDTFYTFELNELTFMNFKKGFLYAVANQEYCLCSHSQSGGVNNIYAKGSIKHIEKFALKLGYKEYISNSYHTNHKIIYTKNKDGKLYNDSSLYTEVLTNRQYEFIKKECKDNFGKFIEE